MMSVSRMFGVMVLGLGILFAGCDSGGGAAPTKGSAKAGATPSEEVRKK